MRRIDSLFLVFFLSLYAMPASAADYLRDLQHNARAQELAQQREWRILLHYREHGGGWRSEVDDPGFFNAPDGKDDPQASLTTALQ